MERLRAGYTHPGIISRLCAHALLAMAKQMAQRSRFVMTMEIRNALARLRVTNNDSVQPFGNVIKLRNNRILSE